MFDYPWKQDLSRFAEQTGLRVDALGLVTMLGADEINSHLGRLVPSAPLAFLPLLGAFVLAGNTFVDRKPGFTLYNISGGIQTTEIAGWFSRWLKAQNFSQAGHVVHVCVVGDDDAGQLDGQRRQCRRRALLWYWIVGLGLVGIPLNGILIALTVLSGDWWGFANAVAMVVSVVVKEALLWQHRAAIDVGIEQSRKFAEKDYQRKSTMYAALMAEYDEKQQQHASVPPRAGLEPPRRPPRKPRDPMKTGKVIVILDDAKTITARVPEYLIVRILIQNPSILRPKLYALCRHLGWAAFAIHVITLGMAALHTQIYSALLLIIATILTVNKLGCDDWKLCERTDPKIRPPPGQGPMSYPCWISSRLQLRCSRYPAHWADWESLSTLEKGAPGASTVEPLAPPQQDVAITKPVELAPTPLSLGALDPDLESGAKCHEALITECPVEAPKIKNIKKKPPPGRRQDLFVWLEPTELEEESMKAWGLLPRSDEYWTREFELKKKEHRQRLGMEQRPLSR